jgi:hypothetical protein
LTGSRGLSVCVNESFSYACRVGAAVAGRVDEGKHGGDERRCARAVATALPQENRIMKFLNPRFVGLLASLAISTAALSIAGNAAAQSQPADPPGRVARLSDLNGQVWLYSPDTGEWLAATRNRPLTTGDRLATDPGARAELQVGSTTLRLDSGSELEILDLDDERMALQLHNGSVAARVRDFGGAGQFDLTTEQGRFILQRAGSYRFDRTDKSSDATVYNGQARYEGPNSALPINAGQRAAFWIDSAGVAQYSETAPVSDAFSAWSGDRDRRVGSSVTARYVSPEMTGAEELDRYGRWEQTPDYGALWVPTTVAVDWAPYRHGHWAWVRPWGWTWVDDAPWGFAPFHYGRWVYFRNNWCWTPGVRVLRPVYAPALVAWVGGPSVNVSVSIGNAPTVGWFPLAPREVYVPSYRVTPRYAQNINITHVTNVVQITNVINNPQAPRQFENRRFPQAITVVPAGVMTDRRPVAPAAAQLRLTPAVRELANQPTRTAALLEAPVTAPAALPRNPDPRAVRPPPGAPAGDRPAFARPGFNPREREGGDRQPGARPAERAEAPGVRPAAPAAPVTAAPAAPVTAGPAAPANPANPAGPTMRPLPVRPTLAPMHPEPDNAVRRAEPAPAAAPRQGSERPAIAAQPQPAAPVAAPARPTPAPAAAATEAPTMRALPVRRPEERREERRGDERPVPARPQAQPPMQPQTQPQIQAPAAPVVRPPQRAEPVASPPPQRQPEVQRAAPPPAQEARRPEPRPRAEPGKEVPEQKRGDPREQQR